MSTLIETLNRFGENALHFAWPMLWQSSVLIAILFAADFALRRRVRAAVRYALWLVLLVKLLLPPTLALPTGVAWWLLPATASAKPHITKFVVSYDFDVAPSLPLQPPTAFTPPRPPLSAAAWLIPVWGTLSFGLLVWMTMRWRQVARDVKCATPAPVWLGKLFDEIKASTSLHRTVRLRLTDQAMSPAVCGLLQPVILLPQSLVQKLPPAQLRAVLLHELTHLRRGDVWMNCAQALAQIVYWWHPLLWFANARIRRVREEAVDDAVMLALRDEAETYAPTLLEVARLAFHRPLASLGLVGILESRNALRQRIERLVNFHAPRKAGLTFISLCGIFIFSAVALPMGESPATSSDASKVDRKENTGLSLNYTPPQIHIKARFVEVPKSAAADLYLGSINPSAIHPDDIPLRVREIINRPSVVAGSNEPTALTGIMTASQFQTVRFALQSNPYTEPLAEPEATTTSGRQVQMRATDILTMITNFALREISTNLAIVPQQSQVEVGPVLDTVAFILPDGCTIDLKVTASAMEFLGYDNKTNTVPTVASTGAIIDVPTIHPDFRVQQSSAHLKLWDGQTVVLGKLPQYFYDSGKELSAEPDYFRTAKRTKGQPGTEEKELLVFITVTLVDPAGNRIHSDDEIAARQQQHPAAASH